MFFRFLTGWSALALASLVGCQTSGGGGGGGGPGGPDEATTGILLQAPEGAAVENFDLYAADGVTLLSQAHSTGEVAEVDPGTYVITQYFNENFVFARDVVVNGGEVTTVPLGAIEVTTPADSDRAVYDIYAEDGETLLSRPHDSGVINPVPPGTYTLKEYFSEFTYVSGLTVTADGTATFEMGAIRYQGPEPSYDIYDASGTIVLVRPADANVTRPMPPGTYVLKDYFSETVLVEDVVVEAGLTTTVP